MILTISTVALDNLGSKMSRSASITSNSSILGRGSSRRSYITSISSIFRRRVSQRAPIASIPITVGNGLSRQVSISSMSSTLGSGSSRRSSISSVSSTRSVLSQSSYQSTKSTMENDSHIERQNKIHAGIPAKDKIKSDKIEPHGEFNPAFGYQKEICKLKFEPEQNYKYKKTLGELDETKQTKVILAVGETGSGKSSTINGMINHIYGINYEDPYRFKLIDDMDSPAELGINTTEEITSYYIPYTEGILNNYNYIIIDTPGFGDLRGIEEDTKMVPKFYDFLKENSDITAVDAICFVIKASDTRLTKKQEYIISGLFSLFGKDVIRNIYIVVTFSDGTETHVPELIKDSGLKYELEMHFDVDGLFNDGKGIKGLTDNDIKIGFQESWDLNMSSMAIFFNALKKKISVSLILTNIVLEENKDINKLIDELLQLIEKEEFTKDAEKLKIQEKIEQNQNLLMSKLDEAKKLTGRLKNIPCKENPMAINEYIDILISSEKDEIRITKLEKVKEKNTVFQNLLKERESNNYNIMNYFLGGKNEKMD